MLNNLIRQLYIIGLVKAVFYRLVLQYVFRLTRSKTLLPDIPQHICPNDPAVHASHIASFTFVRLIECQRIKRILLLNICKGMRISKTCIAALIPLQ